MGIASEDDDGAALSDNCQLQRPHSPDIIVSNCVFVKQSPYLDTFYGHHNVRLTIDSGAIGNIIRIIS